MEIQNEIPQVHRSGSGHNTQILFIYIFYLVFLLCVFCCFFCLVFCCRFPFCIQISPNIYLLTVRTTNTKPGIGHVHVFFSHIRLYCIIINTTMIVYRLALVEITILDTLIDGDLRYITVHYIHIDRRTFKVQYCYIDRRRFKVHYCSL